MSYTAKKLLISLLIFITGIIAAIYFSTVLHLLLSAQTRAQALPTFTTCITSIASDESHRMLFLCLAGFILLLSILIFVANNKPYQSTVRKITPQIITPVPAGQNQHGSAKWLSDKEKETVFDSYYFNSLSPNIKSLINQSNDNNIQYTSKGGVAIGTKKRSTTEKLYFIGDDVHTLCIGATRSGKTRTVVLQSIGMLALAGESMILTDPKGELYQYTYPFLERLGYEVFVIDFKNPLKSHKYNFLQPIIDAVDADDIAKAVDATWDLTSALVGESKGERIWTDGEASIIASAIMSVVYDNRDENNRKYQNITNVYYFISEMCKTVNDKMPILEYVKKLKDGHPAKGLLAISEVAPTRTRGSFYTAALTTLRLFTNPMINFMTCASDYDPGTTGSKKQAIFIILPDDKTTYYSLASLLVSQHYEQLVKAADARGGRLLNRVNMICEEFGNFVKIPDFANKLTVGGGRGIRFNLFLQSFAQLNEKYGNEVAKTIKGNCEVWIYLQANDIETLKEISEKLGNYTVSTYSLSASHAKFSAPSSSHSINLTGRALLTPDEVSLISRPYSLITSRTNPAIMYAPDLSKMYFNKMFGLGNKEHNRQIRELRENNRVQHDAKPDNIELWNVWDFYTAVCEQKEKEVQYTGERRVQLKSQQYTYALQENFGAHVNDNE